MSQLKKSQRRKRNEKRKREQDAAWVRAFGKMPAHIEAFLGAIEPNTDRIHRERWELAPAHVVDADAFCVETAKMAEYSARAAIARTDDRAETMNAMRQEFPDLWGVRGAAQTIADEWFARTGARLSVRTIQNYLKLTRG